MGDSKETIKIKIQGERSFIVSREDVVGEAKKFDTAIGPERCMLEPTGIYEVVEETADKLLSGYPQDVVLWGDRNKKAKKGA